MSIGKKIAHKAEAASRDDRSEMPGVDEASSVDPGFFTPRSGGPLDAPTVYVARTSVCVNFDDLENPWPPHLTYPRKRRCGRGLRR